MRATKRNDGARAGRESPSREEGPPFAWKVRIYYEDTDAGGIVYYANYLRFFERARTEWLRTAGISQQTLVEIAQVQFVVRRLTLDFIAAARLDDVLVISVRPMRLRNTSVDLSQEAVCAGRTICRAEATLACVRKTDFKPVRLPDFIAKLMAPWPA